ncbi:MAG: O-antigen ligase family protein [Catalinimonas sp.]
MHRLPWWGGLRRYLLAAVALTLPLSMRLNTLLVLSLALHWLLEGDWPAKWQRWRTRPAAAVYLSLYVLYALGMLYTEHQEVGWYTLEKKAALLAFPLMLGSVTLSPRDVRWAVWALVGGCAAVTLMMLAGSLRFSLGNGGARQLFELYAGGVPLRNYGLHRTYLAYYLLLSLAALLVWLRRGTVYPPAAAWAYARPSSPTWAWALVVAAVVLFGATIVLMRAQMAILIVVLSVSVWPVVVLWRRAGPGWAVALLLTAGLTTAAALLWITPLHVRTDRFIESLGEGNAPHAQTSSNLRVLIWQGALTTAADRPWLGAGTGDGNAELFETYAEQAFEWGVAYRFNAHNQYLQTTLALGVVGLLVLALHLGTGLRLAWRRGDRLFAAFVLITALCWLTESMLERQKGVVLYAFLLSLLSFVNPESAPLRHASPGERPHRAD